MEIPLPMDHLARPCLPIFWFVRLNEILFEPIVLVDQCFDAVIHEIVDFG